MGDTILSERGHQIWSFGSRESEKSKFEEETISLEERVDRDRKFTYVFNKQKLRFLQKCKLYINGFCNSEQFDSIWLDHVYQLVEPVVSHGKYEVNI